MPTDPRQELEDLRRMDELQRRAASAGIASSDAPKDPNAFAKAARITGQEYQAGDQSYRSAMKAFSDKMASGQAPGIGDMIAPAAAALRAIPGALFKGPADAAFGDKPLIGGMTGGDIAQMAIPFVGEAGNAVRGLATVAPKIADGVGDVMNTLTQAGRRANTATDAMRTDTAANLASGQASATAQAAADADKASRAAALAQRAKARQSILTSRQADAAQAATPPALDIGTPAHLSDIGDQVRAPALAQQADIEAQMKDTYAKHDANIQAIAADQALSGVGVSDTPTAQALIAKSKSLVQPNPVTQPDVSTSLANTAGGNLHQQLLDTLQPQKVPLSVSDANQARAAGATVLQDTPGGPQYRLVKPNLQTADNFRRFLGKVMSGDVEGYGAINKNEAGDMYKGVSNAIDEYVGGARAPAQAAYAASKKALEPFEKIRSGQALVGMQKGTNIPSVPTASIPGRIISGGRDTVQQAGSVAGPAPVAQALRSQVQNTLSGVNGSDAISKLVGTGTKLGDAINSDDSLSAAVQDYLAKTRSAEASGVQAENLGQRANTSGTRAKSLSDIADALQGTSQKSTAVAGGYARDLANLEIADPKSVGSMYSDMLNRAHQDGSISIEKYAEGQKLAASAQKDFALKSTRDKWMLGAGAALGLGAIPGGLHAASGLFKAIRGAGN